MRKSYELSEQDIKELDIYKCTLKDSILKLVNEDNIEEAKLLIDQYEEILPGDIDISLIKSNIESIENTADCFCPVCDSKEIRKFFIYTKFVLFECINCKLIFQDENNRTKSGCLIPSIYNREWVLTREKYARNTFIEHSTFNNLLLNMYAPNKGELLEIGPGTGESLYLAKKSGWKVTGVEPSKESCLYAKEKYDIDIINNVWSPSVIEKAKLFDVITFWHVLEHISNPVEFFNDLKNHIKPNGLIMFSIPNRESFTNEIQGYESPLYSEPDHLFHYSKENLLILIDKVFLEPLSIFSREEINRFCQDIYASNQRNDEFKYIGFEESMGLMSRLQSDFRGHELFCIAKFK